MAAIMNPARGLALIRMGVGLYFFANGYDKLSHGWLRDGNQLQRMLQGALRRSPHWYADFLQGTVLPHISLFARLVTVGELSVGISLFLGLLTPIGALGAMWLTTNYMLQSPVASLIVARDRLFILCGLVFLLCSAGAVWSMDSLLPRLTGRIRSAEGGRRDESGGLSGGITAD